MATIQRMGPGDAARVRAVRLRALRDAPDAYWTTADEEAQTTLDEWRDRLTRPDRATFVATLNGTDVGLVVGEPHYEDVADAGLYSMWVAPEVRGQGVGERLIHAVIGWARSEGYRCLRLEVADANPPAVALYERMGFTPTGRVDHLPPPREHITEHERVLRLEPEPPVRRGSR